MDNQYHVFLGLVPSSEMSERIKKFQRGKAKPSLKWIPYEKLHLTLFFWPALSEMEYNQLFEEINLFNFNHNILKEMESSIKGYHFFLGAKVLYLKEISETVFNIHRIFKPLLEKVSFPFLERKEFVPHWTFARKFHVSYLQKYKEYFYALDKFIMMQKIHEIGLFISKNGEYYKRVIISTDNKII